jgi:hypothetical protein
MGSKRQFQRFIALGKSATGLLNVLKTERGLISAPYPKKLTAKLNV